MIDAKKPSALSSVLTYDDARVVSPAPEHYTKGLLLDGSWKRPELSPRDRSVITCLPFIERIHTIEMPFHFALALDNGVKASELSEIITHLTFYAGGIRRSSKRNCEAWRAHVPNLIDVVNENALLIAAEG
jgi:4-carboxymuconolactone decarboxylase